MSGNSAVYKPNLIIPDELTTSRGALAPSLEPSCLCVKLFTCLVNLEAAHMVGLGSAIFARIYSRGNVESRLRNAACQRALSTSLAKKPTSNRSATRAAIPR